VPPSPATRVTARTRQISPAPLAGVMTGPVNMNQELSGEGRLETDLSRVRPAGSFDPRADAVTQRVSAATAQTRTQSRFSAGRPRQKARSGNGAGAQGKRGGGERAGQAKPVKPPQLGGLTTQVTQLQSERSLRVKRSDP
jgi:hypothetical protein